MPCWSTCARLRTSQGPRPCRARRGSSRRTGVEGLLLFVDHDKVLVPAGQSFLPLVAVAVVVALGLRRRADDPRCCQRHRSRGGQELPVHLYLPGTGRSLPAQFSHHSPEVPGAQGSRSSPHGPARRLVAGGAPLPTSRAVRDRRAVRRPSWMRSPGSRRILGGKHRPVMGSLLSLSGSGATNTEQSEVQNQRSVVGDLGLGRCIERLDSQHL